MFQPSKLIALCIRNNGYEKSLIIGKKYNVIRQNRRFVIIQLESGVERAILKNYFQIINEGA